jgi:VanZ family protein
MSSWLWVFIWIAIAIEDGFPVIIRQERIGIYGKLFKNYKFRSMKKSTLKEQVRIQATEGDLRVTRVGRILRKCALDELPQLINIFLGQMSFVGPRALLPEEKEVHLLGNADSNGGTLNITEIPGFYQRATIRKSAFWLDLKLIFVSFLVTFRSSWERRGVKLGILDRQQVVASNTWLRPFLTYWLPLGIFLVVILPVFNIYDKYLCTWDTFRVFGDSIRLIVPETPLYVLTTLWGAVRKLSHLVVYAVLTGLLFRGFRGKTKRLSLKNFVYPGLVAMCFSFADEFAQHFMPNRGASIGDCTVDGLAILFVLLLLFRKYRAGIVKEHPGLGWVERPLWNTNSIKKYAYSWLPVVAYIGVLFVAANILLTNENTLRIINHLTAWIAPDTDHAFACMVVSVSRNQENM